MKGVTNERQYRKDPCDTICRIGNARAPRYTSIERTKLKSNTNTVLIIFYQ